jgi:glutathione synthase/RimK-type ligase-like ATP-grasp enzyme
MKIRAVILANERSDEHLLWIRACQKFSGTVEWRVVNMTSWNWLEEVEKEPFDILLAKPGGMTSVFKQLYDERVYILGVVKQYNIFPSPEEIFIYENKRFLSYWLKANSVPHPATFVFYNEGEATEFLRRTRYPIVAKVNIGASGSGVVILYTVAEAVKYLMNVFSGRGAFRRHGPNLRSGNWGRRALFYFRHPEALLSRLSVYRTVGGDPQKNFVLFQEYIPHDFEWRVVRTGDSFFAHKKLKSGEKASGSLLKSYCNPPVSLLDFVKEVTDRHKFYSQAIDIFETEQGYLVNEMQCIFGQSDPHQMEVDGKPGRYRFTDGHWLFEPGDFNGNECYDARLEWVIGKYGYLKS